MALTYPYPLAFLSDLLRCKSVNLKLQRFDETSGSGDGRVWSAQLARPLWTADIALSSLTVEAAREIEAKIDALDGQGKTFLFADQTYKGPASGTTAGLGAVNISTIRSTDRGAIGLTGVPNGFRLSAGDYLSIAYGDRVYFGRFIEGGTASSNAITQKEIRPYLPLNVAVGARVELVKPYMRATIQQNGWNPFRYEPGEIASDATLSIIQRP